MRKDLVDVTLVVDRSGSMDSCKVEAENGLNSFIDEQRKQPGETLLTLVEFDNDYNFVHKGVNVKDVGRYRLYPRGMTALLDAVGRAINETGSRLAKMSENDRPGLVVIAIITDGGENASHEFTKTKIKEMIDHQTNKYNWKFTFLGANQDAFGEGGGLGVLKSAIGNYSTKKSQQAYSNLSANVSRMRSATLNNLPANCEYTTDELKAMA